MGRPSEEICWKRQKDGRGKEIPGWDVLTHRRTGTRTRNVNNFYFTLYTALGFGVSQQNAKFLPASQTYGGGIRHIHATAAPSSGVGGLAMT